MTRLCRSMVGWAAAGVLWAGSWCAAQVSNAGGSDAVPVVRVNPATGLPGEMLENLTFEEADAKARRGHRLLVVFVIKGREIDLNAMRERCSRNQLLHAYLKWHCVALETNDLPKWANDQIERRRKAQRTEGGGMKLTAEYPAMVVFRNDQLEATVWTWRLKMVGTDDGFNLGFQTGKNVTGPLGGRTLDRLVDRPWHVPVPNDVVLQTHFALERAQVKDPIWGEMHERKNPPPPPPPEPEPLCWSDSVSGARVVDPTERDAELRTGLERLAHARALLKSGEFHEATGYLSWVWERGEKFDPAMRPARLSVVVEDLKRLCAARPGADQHVGELRARVQLQHPWADYPRWADLLAIHEAMNDGGEGDLRLLDAAINDRDAAAVLPQSDKTVWTMLMEGVGSSDRAWVSNVRRIAGMIGRSPRGATPEQTQAFDAFVRDHLRNQACRVYAGLLARGRDTEAMEAAGVLLKVDGSALSKAALVTTALAQEPPQAREHQRAWAAEAGAARAEWRALSEAVDRAMKREK